MGWRPSLGFHTCLSHLIHLSKQWTAEAATMSKQWTAEAATCMLSRQSQLSSCPGMLSRQSQLPRNFATRRAARGRGLPTANALPTSRRNGGCPAGSERRSLAPVPVGVLLGVAEVILLELHNDERDLGLHHFPRLGVLVDPPSWLRNPVSGRDRLN